MVEVTKTQHIKEKFTQRKRWAVCASLGIIFLVFSVVLFFFNPLLLLAKYELRVKNGSILFNILSERMDGAKLQFYLFNYTNVDEYLSGKDDRLKLKEVGPFVYQEHRTNEDLVLDPDLNIMKFTPRYHAEFLLEESIGRPEDIELFLPNVPYLTALRIVGTLPSFIGSMFKMATAGLNLKPLPKVTAHDYFWGVLDPYIGIVNRAIPGLVYYNNSGLLTRFYDLGVNFTVTSSTLESEKFQLKSVERYQYNNETKKKSDILVTSYSNAYEGAAFPPDLTPSTPISIYRYAICKLLSFKYNATIRTNHGTDAFEYVFSEEMFKNNTLCDKKGCPYGISDLSKCYMGFPFALSKGHFLDADPRLFDRIEGLNPNRSIHESKLYIDPQIGITLDSYMSGQFSLALTDMSAYSSRLSDMYLPVTHCISKHPKVPKQAETLLNIYYHSSTIIYCAQGIYVLLGLGLLLYSRKVYWHNRRTHEKNSLANQNSVMSKAPLLS